jgi:hypothetical protein
MKQPIPEGKYRIGRVVLAMRLDYLDEQGNVTREVDTNPFAVFPAEFGSTLLEILQKRGIEER